MATAPPPEEAFARMEAGFSSMTANSKKIASYLLENRSEAAFGSAADAASKVGVSEAAVVRFASALGYGSYMQFRKALQSNVKARLDLLDRLEVQRLPEGVTSSKVYTACFATEQLNLTQTLHQVTEEQFTECVDAVVDASTVYVVGARMAAGIARITGGLLQHAGLRCTTIESTEYGADSLLHASKGDVVIVITLSRYVKRLSELVDYSRERQCTVVAITDSVTAPVAMVADLVLVVGTRSHFFGNSYVAALALCQAVVAASVMRRGNATQEALIGVEKLCKNLFHA